MRRMSIRLHAPMPPESLPDAAVPETVWDPFSGTIPFERTPVAEPGSSTNVPGWVGTAIGIGALLSTVLVLAGIFSTTLAWVGGGVLTVTICAVALVDRLARSRARRDWRFFELAKRNGWAFRLIEPLQRRRRGQPTAQRMDPLAARAAQAIPELCSPRPGQLIPLVFQALFWGRSASGLPFWMGLQEYEVDATLATEAVRKDAFANRGLRGRLYMIALAYQLDRDTMIRAKLLAEPFGAEGWRDIKTESVEFNRAFNIAIGEDRGSGDAQLALLRTLTPATQATLLDLHRRYRIQMLIDGATVILAGQERVMSEDEDVVAQHFGQLVDAFAAAAMTLKPYAE